MKGDAGSSAFLDSFLNDQHLKRMKLNEETAGSLAPKSVFPHPPPSSSSPLPSDPYAGLSTTSVPFFSSSPEECISRISANHVVLVDLDSWGRPFVEIGDNRRSFPQNLFIYGFSSIRGGDGGSGGGGGGLSSLLSSNQSALEFFQRVSNEGQFLLHRQPEFGVEMTLRYQAGRLDVVLDVATSLTILVGHKCPLLELQKQFHFNAMRNRRDIGILDPRTCTLNTLVERILFVAGKSAAPPSLPPVGDEEETRRLSQHQPIVIDL